MFGQIFGRLTSIFWTIIECFGLCQLPPLPRCRLTGGVRRCLCVGYFITWISFAQCMKMLFFIALWRNDSSCWWRNRWTKQFCSAAMQQPFKSNIECNMWGCKNYQTLLLRSHIAHYAILCFVSCLFCVLHPLLAGVVGPMLWHIGCLSHLQRQLPRFGILPLGLGLGSWKRSTVVG